MRRFLLVSLSFIIGLSFFRPDLLLGKQKPVKVDLYVMGQCPFSAQLENTLLLIMKETKNPVQMNLFYIASETADGNFNSLRGAS
ncbi:MAG: hypothetical protein HYS56_06065, partial [Candidatus Omnitrophica bacterium]|nr:hypothetical protein [Candidatus Omnitrophota bacterium]